MTRCYISLFECFSLKRLGFCLRLNGKKRSFYQERLRLTAIVAPRQAQMILALRWQSWRWRWPPPRKQQLV